MKVTLLNGAGFKCDDSDTVLESALKQNVYLEYSCKTGQCGICEALLLDGEVQEIKPQLALDKSDTDKFLTCCCKPLTDISIDAEDLSQLRDIEQKVLPARINKLHKINQDLIQVKLRLPPNSSLKFIEGQYVDVIKGSIRRSYSLANSAEENQLELFIKCFSNGEMSRYWFNEAKLNDLLRIEGPKGTFFLRESGPKKIIFLATGTGIAPIISILKSFVSEYKEHSGYEYQLFWGNRYKEDFFELPDFSGLPLCIFKVISQQVDSENYLHGYVQDVALQCIESFNDLSVYACGSNKMIQDAKQKFVDSGLKSSEFHSDAFVQSFS